MTTTAHHTPTKPQVRQAGRNIDHAAVDVIARAYLRVSQDRSGRERSTTEQGEELAPAAEWHGWTYGDPYTDQGSASRFATKERSDYQRLLADLRADTFGAQVLMLWEFSRGSRDVGEWATLLDLCAQRGVLIHVHTHGRTYDPTNGRDRRSMIDDANDSEYESYKTSVRVTRDSLAVAQAGGIWGRAPFGYVHVYDPQRGKLIGREIDPIKSPMIVELFERIASGKSGASIVRKFTQDGWRNGAGNPFTWNQLRQMAMTATYAGKRVHDPNNKYRHPPYSADATFTDAVWEPIVSWTKFLAVQEVLTRPERVTTRPGRGIHLLSMKARCDTCGGPMAVRMRKQRTTVYSCWQRSCTQVPKGDLDRWATAAILAYLSDEHTAVVDDPSDAENVALVAVQADLAAKRADYDDFTRRVIAGEFDAAFAGTVQKGKAAAIAELEARETALRTPSRLVGLIRPGADVIDRWEAAPMAVRRQIVELLFAPDTLGTLRVVKSDRQTGASHRRGQDVSSRVRVVPGE